MSRPQALLALLLLAPMTCSRQAPEPAEPGDSGGRVPARDTAGCQPGERLGERRAMVARQLAARGITDQAVLAAMEAVPRHCFVPERIRDHAYDDAALPIPADQTISQPYIVALMTESAKVSPEAKVLEVGTGSGYQAAVLAELTPHVFTIEIVDELAQLAERTLVELGYGTVRCRAGDGYRGWPEEAPFDAILVTAAPDHVPPALLDQLAPGGRLCLPVGGVDEVQELRLITKGPKGQLIEERITAVRFVPMTGEAQRR